jgi:hypothetical protein
LVVARLVLLDQWNGPAVQRLRSVVASGATHALWHQAVTESDGNARGRRLRLAGSAEDYQHVASVHRAASLQKVQPVATVALGLKRGACPPDRRSLQKTTFAPTLEEQEGKRQQE